MTSKTWLRFALVAFATAGLISCGGGGGGGTTAVLTANFVPDSATPAAGSVSMQRGSVAAANFNVDVRLSEVTGVFGAAFRVTYPTTSVQYQSFDSSGSRLRATTNPAPNAPFFSVDATTTPGTLYVVATRTQNSAGTAPGVDFTGTNNLLITLRFRATTTISTPAVLAFSATNRDVVGPTGASIAITGWSGGGVTAAVQ